MRGAEKKSVVPIKVLVCGAREWTDRETIRAWLSRLPPGTTVIHGAARGADSIAGEVAAELGFTVRSYPANWQEEGKAAGPLRNQRMLDAEHVTLPILGSPHPGMQPIARCFAFSWIRDEEKEITRGTADMVVRCLSAGIPTTIIPPGGL